MRECTTYQYRTDTGLILGVLMEARNTNHAYSTSGKENVTQSPAVWSSGLEYHLHHKERLSSQCFVIVLNDTSEHY